MFSRLRMWFLKTPVLVALGLVAAYFLFAWFGFEPLVEWVAPKMVADRSKHELVIGSARFDPLALSVDVKGLKLNEPDGQPLLSFDELFADFEAASLFRWTYTFQNIRMVNPHASVVLLAGGRLNWSAFIDAFKGDEDRPDKPVPRLLVRRVELVNGRVDLNDRRVGFATALNPVDLTVDDLSTLPEDKGLYSLTATTGSGARILWKGEWVLSRGLPTQSGNGEAPQAAGRKPEDKAKTQPAAIVATGRLGIERVSLEWLWPYLENNVNMGPPQGQAALAFEYRVNWAEDKLSLVLDKLSASVAKLLLRGKEVKDPAIRLDTLALSGGHFDLDQRSLEVGAMALTGGQVRLDRDRKGHLDIEDWFTTQSGKRAAEPAGDQSGREGTSTASTAAKSKAAWRVNLAAVKLDGLAMRLRDATFRKPLGVEVSNVRARFVARGEARGTSAQAQVDSLEVDVSGIRLSSTGEGKPFLHLNDIKLSDGHIDLAGHSATAGSVMLSGGSLDVSRDSRGNISLIEALQPADSAPAPKPASHAEPSGLWHYRVGEVGLDGFQVSVRDEGVQPTARITLEHIAASVKDASDNLKAALPVRLSLKVKGGGAFQADGTAVIATPAADLRFKLTNLTLGSAQPYISRTADLTLASGALSASGRVKYDGKLTFDGGFRADNLLLNESVGGARFLAWKSMESDSMSYRPGSLNIEELRLDGLACKLVIYPDKTVNLKKILKSQPAPPPAGAPTAANSAATKNLPATRVTIDRVRVENGEMDFADQSLALPFGARIHDFKGTFNGISTQPGSAAQLELDGQVDEYGLARAVGQLDLFDPTSFMDIKVVFRNVEMNRLTPYTATFVGRKIESGKLSLDLEYKIKERQMLGENQIVMDKLTLGDRVKSPTAKDLPLDLAIAILQDGEGRIDLGLPVSGSLDDPQFSYGGIIWKAISNIITRIVTAPFRALASLFGGNGEKLEQVAFEAGGSALTPPEREELKQIATILNKRPKLALTVHPAWSDSIDRPVMKETRLRLAVVEKTGVKLKPNEDPGPISTANPKVRVALETLYTQQFGKDAWKTLQSKWFKANPEKRKESNAGKLMSRLQGLVEKQEPISEGDMNALKGRDLHTLLYDRLLAKTDVGETDLRNLARRRGETVRAGLAAAGVPTTRIMLAEEAPFTGQGREIPLRMELGLAAK